ncbi:MAG: hypothetical protein ACFFD7_08230 [Candidatus Thorarchaeota archaeon]
MIISKLILILSSRKIIQKYTKDFPLFIAQKSAPVITGIIIATISLAIWFSCGLIFAYWVKKDMEKENLKGKGVFLLILLTSFIGFIVYIIVSRGETGLLESNETFSETDETIKKEEEAEFYDEVEEINEEVIEEVIEDVFNNILDDKT